MPPTFWVKDLLCSEAGWPKNDICRYYVWGGRLLGRPRRLLALSVKETVHLCRGRGNRRWWTHPIMESFAINHGPVGVAPRRHRRFNESQGPMRRRPSARFPMTLSSRWTRLLVGGPYRLGGCLKVINRGSRIDSRRLAV